MPCPDQPFDRDAAAAEWLPRCQRIARRETRGRPDLTEGVCDELILQLVRALNDYTSDRGPWKRYIRFCLASTARRAVAKALRRSESRPASEPIGPGAEPAARPPAASELSPDTLRALPPELRQAVQLYCLDGHTMREAAALAGVGREAFRGRLFAAAERLGLADAPPPQRPGVKRLRPA